MKKLITKVVGLAVVSAGLVFAQSGVVQVFFEDFDTPLVDCRVDLVFPGWQIGDGGSCTTPAGACDINMYRATWTVRNAVVPFWCGTNPLGGQVAELYYNTTCFHLDTLVTPVIDLSAYASGGIRLTLTHVFDLWFTNYGYIEVFDGSQWVKIDSFGSWTNDHCGRLTYDVTPYAAGNPNFRVRFVYYDNNDWYWRIDSVAILAYPCGNPTGLQVIATCPDSLVVTWDTAYGGDTVFVEFGPAGFAFGSGTRVGVAVAVGRFDTSLPAGTYDVYVWGKCGTNYSDTLVYTLDVGINVPLPHVDTFTNGPNGWQFSGVAGLVGNTACGGVDSFIELGGQAGSFAVSPTFCIPSGACKVKLFYLYRGGDDLGCGNDPETSDQVQVQVSFDGGTTWNPVVTYDGATDPDVFTYDEYYINVPPGATTLQVRFFILSGSGGSFDHWYFDSVGVLVPPLSDLAISSLGFKSCPGDSVEVCVKNVGCVLADFTVDSLHLWAVAYDGLTMDTLHALIAGDSLLPDSELCIVMPPAGVPADSVQLIAWMIWGADQDSSNNVAVTYFNSSPIPFTEGFGTAFWSDVQTLGTGWVEARGSCCDPGQATVGNYSWSSNDWMNAGGTNMAASINLWTLGKRDWIISPLVFIPVDSPEVLFKFDLGIWQFATSTPGDFQGADDSLVVVYSQDCGKSWNVLAVWDSTNTPIGDSLVYKTVLPNTTGYFMVAFWASEGANDDANDNDVMVDDINIDALTRDVGVVAIQVNPPTDTICRGTDVQVVVNMYNFGELIQDSVVIFAWTSQGDVYQDTLFVGLPEGMSLIWSLFSFTMSAVDSVEIYVVVSAYPWDANSLNDTARVVLYRTPAPQTVLIAPDTAVMNVPTSVGMFTFGTPHDQILWDFGSNAVPQTATGIGPITVKWTQPGWQKFRVAVTYCSNVDTLWIEDSVFVLREVTALGQPGEDISVWIVDNGRGQPVIMSQQNIYRVRMFDVKGGLIVDELVNDRQWMIPVGRLSDGVYVIEVMTAGGDRYRFKVK